MQLRSSSFSRKTAVTVTPTVSEVYWRAICDTVVYCGPLGVSIASVQEETIVKEYFRYYDVFDNLWIATNGEDGGTVWLRPFPPYDLDEESDEEDVADWEIVECVGPSNITADTNKMDKKPIVQPVRLKPLYDGPLLPVPSDDTGPLFKLLSSIGYYWDILHVTDSRTEGYRDWNTEYQLLLEDVLYNIGPRASGCDIEEVRKRIHCLVQDFADIVERTVVMIVQEMFEPNEKKTVQTLPTAVGTYFYSGILFMLNIDTDGSIGGDEQAMKIAGESARCVGYLSHTAPKNFIHTPITITMTYAGFRVQAVSIPPIGGKGAQNCVTSGMSGFVDTLVKETANELRLSQKGKPYLPSDAKVFYGYDCRLYVFHGSRLLPPQIPPRAPSACNFKVNAASRRLRPEAMDLLSHPLNPDALVVGHSIEEMRDLQAATNWIRDELIPSVSSILGFMEPCPADLELPTDICKGCSKRITDELRFSVCDSKEHCCVICPQCYINAMGVLVNGQPEGSTTAKETTEVASSEEAANNTNVTADGDTVDESEEITIAKEEAIAKQHAKECTKLLTSYVHCGAHSRSIRGLHMIPDVTSLFHCKGLNLRFLQAVYYSIPLSAKCFTAQYLEIEIVARAAKHILWKKLRSTKDPDEAVDVCGKFFTALMEPDGECAEKFWASELGPYIRKLFDVFVPFDTELLPISLVYERVSALTGVELTTASIESFVKQSTTTESMQKKDDIIDRPFVQIKHIHSVMKMIRIPAFCEMIGGRLDHLRDNLAGLLLFWAGVHDDKSKELFTLHHTKQPLYLTKRDFLS